MKRQTLPVPGIVLGAYPQRRDAPEGGATARSGRAEARLAMKSGIRRYDGFMATLKTLETAGGHAAPAADASLRGLRAALARDGLTDALIAQAFVLVKRAFANILHFDLFDTQILAARIMLDQRLAEMATGEGKTAAAAVCAATAALAGIPVHVITANDYLVARDAEFLRPVYAALGLSVAAVTQNLDRDARCAAYDCDVVYCTASELVFDYLRDGLTRERSSSELQRRVAAIGPRAAAGGRATLLRGLCMAIVDEADSVLIDDARMPLILSERRSNEGEREYLRGALSLAAQLVQAEHFVLHRQGMYAELTPAGRSMAESSSAKGPWRNRLYRDESLCMALSALHLYERDRHYMVRDGTINIIDESTGRLAAGRVWSRGLHLLIELKEQCAPSGDTAALAQITYQRFFQRYLGLSGMSGTLTEARGELLGVYGLPVVKVPLARPDRRSVAPTQLFADREAQWQAVVAQAIEVSRRGRPVLIGTDSLAESEEISRRLHAAGAEHAVLNARQDGDEARIIAEAGGAGRITVSTNMAGRGTDIALAAGIAEIGGLHVISCQHNAARRIDRQLLGRCARRGDPGSAQTLLALDKPLIARIAPRWLAKAIGGKSLQRPRWLVRALVRLPQRLEETRQRAQRRQLLERDRRAARTLGFGRSE